MRHLGFCRAADVLERNAVCLFGTDEFSRAVASRMSNVAQATNPASKIISADALSVPPDASMMLVHVLLEATDAEVGVPLVSYEEEGTLALRLASAVDVARDASWPRVSVLLPGTVWLEAGPGALRPALRHYAARRPLLRLAGVGDGVASYGSLSIALASVIGDEAFSKSFGLNATQPRNGRCAQSGSPLRA